MMDWVICGYLVCGFITLIRCAYEVERDKVWGSDGIMLVVVGSFMLWPFFAALMLGVWFQHRAPFPVSQDGVEAGDGTS